MTSTAMDLNEDSLLFLDFDPEVACERAGLHSTPHNIHHGSSKATHYVNAVCAHCKKALRVSPTCKAYIDRLRSDNRFYWKHDACGMYNISQDTVTILGEV